MPSALLLSMSIFKFYDDRAGEYRQTMRIRNSFAQTKETIVIKDIHLRYDRCNVLNRYLDEDPFILFGCAPLCLVLAIILCMMRMSFLVWML